VFDFVRAKETTLEKYNLVGQFPRKVYTNGTITLQDAGLVPKAVLYVEEELNLTNLQVK
jgi:hypothetical protein